MGILRNVLDFVFLLYFITHIPPTIIVDSQCVLPATYFPKWAKEAVKGHIQMNDDHLVRDKPVWFVSLITCEALFQLPFFFVAVYAFIKRRNWIRIPSIIYGTHVATTMVPILSDILFGPEAGPKRFALFGIYLPYFIIPVLLVIRMAAVTAPFGTGSTQAGKRKVQ